MRSLLFVTLVVLCVAPALQSRADDRITTTFGAKVTPSGPLKAFKGPEGQVVVMLEINEGKEILVYLKNLGGELEGKTLRYSYEDLGHGTKNAYLDHKRGSKPYRTVLLAARDNRWTFFQPKSSTEFELTYSETASDKFRVDDIVKAIHPDTKEHP